MVLCEQSTLPQSKLEFTLRVYWQIGGFNKQPYKQGPKLTHAKSSKNQMQGTHHLANHFIMPHNPMSNSLTCPVCHNYADLKG